MNCLNWEVAIQAIQFLQEFSPQTGLNCLNGVSVNFLFYADLLIFTHTSFILCILVQIGFAAALLNVKVNIMLIAVHYHVLIWVNPLFIVGYVAVGDAQL